MKWFFLVLILSLIGAYSILDNKIYNLMYPASTILEDKAAQYFIVKNSNYKENENKKILFYIPGNSVSREENYSDVSNLNLHDDIEETIVFIYPQKAKNKDEIIMVFGDVIKKYLEEGLKPENAIALGYCVGASIATQIINNIGENFGMFINYKSFSSFENLIDKRFGKSLKYAFKIFFRYKWEMDTAKIFRDLPVLKKHIITTTEDWGIVPFDASLYYGLKKSFPLTPIETEDNIIFYNIRELHSKFNKEAIVISNDYISEPIMNFIDLFDSESKRNNIT